MPTMKNGERRKANKRKNLAQRTFVAPQGVKQKGRHKNPAWLKPPDAKSLREMFNQAIGLTLLNALKIDFVGIMEKEAERAEREGSKPEKIQ